MHEDCSDGGAAVLCDVVQAIIIIFLLVPSRVI